MFEIFKVLCGLKEELFLEKLYVGFLEFWIKKGSMKQYLGFFGRNKGEKIVEGNQTN